MHGLIRLRNPGKNLTAAAQNLPPKHTGHAGTCGRQAQYIRLPAAAAPPRPATPAGVLTTEEQRPLQSEAST